MTELKQRFQLMLLVATVFAVFYPTLSAEISLVDDYGAILGVFNEDNFSIKNTFFPRSSEGGYYRPFIGVSYWLDKKAWFLHENLMHFESVVAHLVNVLLVYLICRKSLVLYKFSKNSWIPLLSSLLFALHPIVTESVNWISGRTDIMMGNFILASVYLLLLYQTDKKKWQLVLGILSGLISILAKEAALGYIIGMPLLIYSIRYDISDDRLPRPECRLKFSPILFLLYFSSAVIIALLGLSYWMVLVICMLYLVNLCYKKSGFDLTCCKFSWFFSILLSLALSISIFVVLRKLAFTSSVSKIGQTVSLMLADTGYTISLFIGAVGFYIKKFFLPLPLNFFILEVDPLYDLFGIAVVLLCMHLLVNRNLASIMAIIGFLLLLPALPFAFATIAWTAYAERYIYLSTAFWIISAFLSTQHCSIWFEKHVSRLLFFSAVICIVAGVITYKRNQVWQKNVTLIKDTITHSPKQRKLRDMYIHALVTSGRVKEAEYELDYALSNIPSIDSDVRAGLMIGGEMVKSGRYDEALDLYLDLLSLSKSPQESLLKETVQLLRKMEVIEEQKGRNNNCLSRLEQYYRKILYDSAKTPLIFIEAGDTAMKSGSFKAAYSSFDRALSLMPISDRMHKVVENKKKMARDRIEKIKVDE